MATTKFKVPNWVQSLIATAADLNPDEVVVRTEDDTIICFQHSKTRTEIVVNKTTGKKMIG